MGQQGWIEWWIYFIRTLRGIAGKQENKTALTKSDPSSVSLDLQPTAVSSNEYRASPSTDEDIRMSGSEYGV